MWNLNLFLSAAHCLNLGVPQFVILGDFDSTDPSELEEKRIKVKGETFKPCFNIHKRQNKIASVNPQAPVAQKITDEVVFRRFQGEGVEFF